MTFQIGVTLVSTVKMMGKTSMALAMKIKCTMVNELDHPVLALEFL